MENNYPTIKKSILRLFTFFLFLGLINDGYSIEKTSPAIQQAESFDYSKITSHPRLLLTQKDERNVRKEIKSNAELKSIHEYILMKSDEMLPKETLFYKKEGKRLLAISREALTRIFYLSYAYRMTKEKKYLQRAEEELNAVCGFEDWNPTHFLDVGEMTMAVAIGYDWLYKDLKGATKTAIKRAILNHAFEDSKVQKNNWFLRASNNWNQVCNAGLVYGALAIYEEYPTESKAIIEQAVESNRLSMESYAPDGNYPEGAGYWGYGTSFEVMLIAALESALGSDAGLSQSPGFLQSAEYILFVNGPIRFCFNYSDCGRSQASNIPMFWFAKKTNNPNLLFEEKKRLEEGIFLKRLDEHRLLPAVLAFAQGVGFSNITPPAKKVWTGKGLTPVVLVRTDWNSPESEYLGVKGGSASTSHGHMDAGSFVYDSKGLRWAMDFGLQSYITLESKGVDLWNMGQNSQRWDVFRYNNKNHNTLTINDKRHRVKGKAFLKEVYDNETERGGEFDLSEIFEGEVKSVIRKVVLKNDSYLEVNDIITTDDKEAVVRWTMATPSEAKILDQSTIELTQKEKKKILKVSSSTTFEMQTWESEDPGTEYDHKNPGTILVGFESTVPANEKVTFTATLKDS